MWNGKLSEINTANYHIHLKLGALPYFQRPYPSGNHALQFFRE